MMTTSNEHNNAPAVPQGEPEAYMVYGNYTRQPFRSIESAQAYMGGLLKSDPEGGYHIRPLRYATPAPAPAPAQEVASAFTTALDIRLAQGWNLTGNAIPVLYTDTINDYQVRRDDVWLCTTDALKTKQEVGLTASQFDLICQAIVALDTGTITMEGNYMLDSDDCIAVVRVMQALFDIKALRAKGRK